MKKIIPLLLLALTGCASTAITEEQTKLNQLHSSANHAGLVEFYKSKIQIDPSDFDAHNELAEAYINIDDIESAHFYLERTIDKQAATSKTYYLKGLVNDKQQEYKQALASFSKAQQLGDDSKEIHFNTGLAHAKLTQYEPAVKSLNEARLRGYSEYAIKNNLGLIYIQQGNYPQAVDILMPLYHKDPLNEKVKSNLAIALIKSGDSERATQLLSVAGETKPKQESSTIEAVKPTSGPVVKEIASTEVKSEDFESELVIISPVEVSSPEITTSHSNALKSQEFLETQSSYAVQLGSYRLESEAKQRLNQLSHLPVSIYIQEVELDDTGMWYRVLSGKFLGYSFASKYLANNEATFAQVDHFIQEI